MFRGAFGARTPKIGKNMIFWRKIELEFDGELWQRCTFYTNRAFGFATAAMYINKTSQHENMAQVSM
jgi:hypothetical protein